MAEGEENFALKKILKIVSKDLAENLKNKATYEQDSVLSDEIIIRQQEEILRLKNVILSRAQVTEIKDEVKLATLYMEACREKREFSEKYFKHHIKMINEFRQKFETWQTEFEEETLILNKTKNQLARTEQELQSAKVENQDLLEKIKDLEKFKNSEQKVVPEYSPDFPLYEAQYLPYEPITKNQRPSDELSNISDEPFENEVNLSKYIVNFCSYLSLL